MDTIKLVSTSFRWSLQPVFRLVRFSKRSCSNVSTEYVVELCGHSPGLRNFLFCKHEYYRKEPFAVKRVDLKVDSSLPIQVQLGRLDGSPETTLWSMESRINLPYTHLFFEFATFSFFPFLSFLNIHLPFGCWASHGPGRPGWVSNAACTIVHPAVRTSMPLKNCVRSMQ